MDWTGILCTFLALVADIQLIIMGTLPLIVPNVLWLTGTHISTYAGVTAAFTAAVIAQLLKTAKETSSKDLIYTYSLSYRRIAVCISGFLYFLAIILTIVGLIITSSCSGKFRALMMDYHVECATKALVDNIQFALQCCGARNYKDWFETDWGPQQSNGNTTTTNYQSQTTSTEATVSRNDTVPFSCCARSAPSACVHQDLYQLGTSTINQQGCNKKLHSAAQAYFSLEIIIYGASLALEIVLLVLLRSQPDSKIYSNSNKGDKKFGEFSNNKFPSSKSLSKSTPSSKLTSSSKSTSPPSTTYTTSS